MPTEVFPTPLADQQVKALHRDQQRKVIEFVRDLEARGCAALSYRLTGDRPLDHLCDKHLGGRLRAIVAFESRSKAWLLLVADHDDRDPILNVYAQLSACGIRTGTFREKNQTAVLRRWRSRPRIGHACRRPCRKSDRTAEDSKTSAEQSSTATTSKLIVQAVLPSGQIVGLLDLLPKPSPAETHVRASLFSVGPCAVDPPAPVCAATSERKDDRRRPWPRPRAAPAWRW